MTTPEIDGVWWMVGFGDPDPGRGIDSGLYPGGGCGVGPGCWILGYPYEFYGVTVLYYPAIQGAWQDPRIDGCIDNEPAAACMAALLSDEHDQVGYFALLTAPKGPASFSFPSASLVAVPPPPVTSATDSAGTLQIDLGPIQTPPAGLVTQTGCTTGLVQGFKVYQQVRGRGEPPPSGRRRDDGSPSTGWELAVGGAGLGGAALPDGSSGSITATDCVDGGTLYLATGLVFEGGFETIHVSQNSTPVACGACLPLDDDGDTFRGDKCAARTSFDCNDTTGLVFPGAPQICDGLNNDCDHPRWPQLDGTGEIDDDGDGLSQCDGDPCPFDPDNDIDGDGRCADLDNCPSVNNPGQGDSDGDAVGDPCDACPQSAENDTDRDGLCGDVDNCPITYNPQQTDDDGDLAGNACDPCPFDPDDDIDSDGRCGDVDICPLDRLNDIDADGLCANSDPCPFDAHNDSDGDGLCGDIDNCPVDFNPGQSDADGDGNGDDCDRFALPVILSSQGTPERRIGIASGDIDGDGDTDIVAYGQITTFTEAQLFWFENLAGVGSAWTRHQVTVVSTPVVPHVQVGDLNGDGRVDIATSKGWFGNASGDGTQWVPQSLGNDTAGEITLVDLDGDGDLDVLAPTAAGVEWHENQNGSGASWNVQTIVSMLAADSTPADVDGDGDMDLFARGQKNPDPGIEYFWFENTNGDGTLWKERTIAGSGTSFGILSSGDVDQDGDTDLMATDGAVQWFENTDANGSAWQRHGITGSGGRPIYIRIEAVDIDGDGDLDALTSRERTVGIDWHENLAGDGAVWKVRTIRSSLFAGNALITGAFVADVDSDGNPDAIGTGALAGGFTPVRIEWYRNLGGMITADAGAAQVVMCTGPGGASVTLDGSRSVNPEGGPLTYTWTGPFSTVVTAEPTTVVTIPPGTHVVQLMVQSASGASDNDSVQIAVRPSLNLTPAPLWPPNHRLIDVTASLGGCAEVAILKSVVSNEPDDAPGSGDGATTQDIQGAVTGTADTEFSLRAERSAVGGGRLYTITYETSGGPGQPAEVVATVAVPSDMAGGPEPLDITVDQNSAGTVLSWPIVPGAISYSVIRGNLDALRHLPDRVDLGSVVCLQAGSSTNTIGSEDAAMPPIGEVYFYAVEYDDGVLRSSYGTAGASLPRAVTSGDCAQPS